ncbi:MAG: single-stranded DNA-binding protein [Anaplasmataceae bacterium]|nr:single-stranded DNA-binding protein [Anaplasmataceae bacterium]
MSHLNRVSLIGRVGKDPEFKPARDGKEFASFTLATSEGYTDKNTGQKVENTEWHNITVFNPGLMNILKQYVKKGILLFVEGSLQTRKYTGADNIDRWSTSIILSPFKSELKILTWPKQDESLNNNTYQNSQTKDDDISFNPSEYEPNKSNDDDSIPW